MATNKQPIFLNTVISKNVEIDNADGTALQTIFTAGTDGGSITNLSATTTDTADVLAVISVNDGAQTNIVGEVNVPAGSGTDGASPTVNLLDSLALPGVLQNDGSLIVGANAVVSVSAKVAVTATKVLSVSSAGGSYSA